MHESCDIVSSFTKIFEREESARKLIPLREIAKLVELLLDCKINSGRIFVAGNGGSASTAEHFVLDLGVGAFKHSIGAHLPMVSLVSNLPTILALGNDLDFDEVFSSQLLAADPKEFDVLLVFSASGNSENILRVLDVAHRLKMKSCAFTGFDGGQATDKCDLPIHIPTTPGDYGIVENIHLSICHAITEYLRNRSSLD